MGIDGKHAEEGDLAERGGRNALVILREAGLLEGDDLAGGLLPRLVDLAVRSFPDLLQLLVRVHRPTLTSFDYDRHVCYSTRLRLGETRVCFLL